jgi:TetR/AcrR family transcriptional regulator
MPTRDGASFPQRGRRTGAGVSPSAITPIYKRLPYGPHRLARHEVILHQRGRIHGAMVEAVAQNGYERTSVKQVIGLAGVSRRSFYEQFANKEGCFLATFDLIARRDIQQIMEAYLATEGSLEDRLRAAFVKFVEKAKDSRKATLLVLVEAQTAGAAGTLRLRKATATCEQLLARSFIESPDASALPKPIVRGITGGLHGAASKLLRETQSAQDADDLAEEMLGWTLLFQTPAAAQMAERMAARLRRRMREISLASAHQQADAHAPDRDDRARLLHHALRLTALHDYRELSAPQIADEARVPIDVFLELFADKDSCFLAGLDMIGGEITEIATDADLLGGDWPRAVRRVVGEIMGYLAERPLYARTIAHEAFCAGACAAERNLELALGIATLLTEGAPSQARSGLAVDEIAGAFVHMVRCQVADGRIQLLATLSDYFAYIVLAPFIGADAAVEILTADPDV